MIDFFKHVADKNTMLTLRDAKLFIKKFFSVMIMLLCNKNVTSEYSLRQTKKFLK